MQIPQHAALRASRLAASKIAPNLLSFPSEFDNAYWTANAVGEIVTADVETAPDGSSADKLIADGSGGSHALQKTAFTVVSGQSYRLLLDAKAAGLDYVALLLSGANGGKYFDVSAGSIGGNLVASPDASAISPLSSGFYRCSIDFTATGTTTVVGIYLSSTGSSVSFTGDSVAGVTIARAYFHEI